MRIAPLLVKSLRLDHHKGVNSNLSSLQLGSYRRGGGREKIAVKLCRSYSSSLGPSLIRPKPHSFTRELCLFSCPPLSIQHKVRLHLMVMSGWERGFLLLLFSGNIAPFRRVSLPARRDPHILPSASDSNHKLTLIFTTSLGIAGSDNRDFAFILYA